MYTIYVKGEWVAIEEKKLIRGLSLRELCDIVARNLEHYAFYIFNPNIEEDIEKDYEKSKSSIFDYCMRNGDCDEEANYVAIGFKEKLNALPLWLIENNEWIVRVESSYREKRI